MIPTVIRALTEKSADPDLIAHVVKAVLAREAELQRQEERRQAKSRPTVYSPEFELFWAVWPGRVGADPKKKAHEAWNAALKRGWDAETITRAAGEHKRRNPVRSEYMPMASTWLNQDRFADLDNAGKPILQLVGAPDVEWVGQFDERWPALAARHRAEKGKKPPTDTRGGWCFPKAWLDGLAA